VDNAVSDQLIEKAAEGPAFHGPRWNGWVVTAIAILCILAFFVTQTVIFAYVIFKDHPEFAHYPNELLRQLADPQFVPKMLTAKNLWLISVISEASLALMTIGFAQAILRASPAYLGLGMRRRPQFWVLAGMGAGAGLFVVSLIIEGVITAIFGPHPQPQALVVANHHGAIDFALDFMSVAIAAPIAEEIFFRGFVFAGLVQRMSPLLAMVISGAFFGVAHFEKWSFLPIFAIGFGLAWVYYNTRSLWVNIVSHATINTISLVVAYLFPQLIK
jgi:membrane protease YdiL (CAAX protease family)